MLVHRGSEPQHQLVNAWPELKRKEKCPSFAGQCSSFFWIMPTVRGTTEEARHRQDPEGFWLFSHNKFQVACELLQQLHIDSFPY